MQTYAPRAFVAAGHCGEARRLPGSPEITRAAWIEVRKLQTQTDLPASLAVAASRHSATFTLNVTVLAPPEFRMTNLYRPSSLGVTFTEHFGPGVSSLPTSPPAES